MAITSHTIGFEGAQTIAQAEAAQVRLRAAVASGASLDIDLAAVTEADLAFVQLLVAAPGGRRQRRWPPASARPCICCIAGASRGKTRIGGFWPARTRS